MSTINIFRIFNRFYTLNYKYRNGIVLGVVLSEDHSEENILVNHGQDIIDTMKCLGIGVDDEYSIGMYVDGIYNIITCIMDMSDDDEWEYFKTIPTCKVVETTKSAIKNYAKHNSYCRFRRAAFTDPVEEKNFLQKLFAIMGWRMFDRPMREDFLTDVFYQAFEKACLEYNGGRVFTQIPTAEVIFEVYNKCLERWNVEKEEA